MTQKLNLGAALGALVIFFLPWLDFQCQGRSIAQQTGIQTITGDGSVGRDLEALARNRGAGEKKNPNSRKAPKSVLTGLAAIAVVGAIIAALIALRSATAGRNIAGCLCALALGLLVAQAVAGFPAVRDMEAKMQAEQRGGKSSDAMSGFANAALASTIQVRYFPAFYIGLAFLGLPTLLLCNGLLDRMKKNSG